MRTDGFTGDMELSVFIAIERTRQQPTALGSVFVDVLPKVLLWKRIA
jgi:hypothetical protein